MSNNENSGIGTKERMVDKVGGMVGQASAATLGSMSASSFAENARSGDLYEIQAAAIAKHRSRSPDVLRFADQLIMDHTTSMHQLESALRMAQTRLKLPDEVGSRHSTMLKHLAEASDEQFDEVWLEQQKLAHKETLTLFEGFGSRGNDPQLASYARSMVPGLQMHRKMVAELRA